MTQDLKIGQILTELSPGDEQAKIVCNEWLWEQS